MNKKEINIIAMDYLYPPNYGGIIDIYFKIKALHKIGYLIHLHIFTKEIPQNDDSLKQFTKSIYYYKTKIKWYHIFSQLPISIISRKNKKLTENLLLNNAPILFESLKTTCLINDIRLKNRIKLLRLHNLEENYFRGVAKSETNLFKKYFFYREAKKFENYTIWPKFNSILTLSEFENSTLQEKKIKSQYIPVFHGNENVKQLSEYGQNILFHGDLSTADNLKSCLFLIDVFKKFPNFNLVIASGSKKGLIDNKIKGFPNIEFVALKDFNHLLQLFEAAHICICWSFQNSGTKLKLINALFNSRFSIINQNIIDDKKIIPLCTMVFTKEELVDTIKKLMKQPYAASEFLARKNVLENHLNDTQNAKKILDYETL